MKKIITYIALWLIFTSWIAYNIYYTVNLKQAHAQDLQAIELAEANNKAIEEAKEKNLECTEYVSNFGNLMHWELYPKQECLSKNASTTNAEERVNCDEEYMIFRKAK